MDFTNPELGNCGTTAAGFRGNNNMYKKVQKIFTKYNRQHKLNTINKINK